MLVEYGALLALLLLLAGYRVHRLRRATRLRGARDKVRDSEALYRQLTEDISDVIWKTDRNLYITYISPVDERLCGYRSDEVIGHHVFEMFTDELRVSATAVETVGMKGYDGFLMAAAP